MSKFTRKPAAVDAVQFTARPYDVAAGDFTQSLEDWAKESKLPKWFVAGLQDEGITIAKKGRVVLVNREDGNGRGSIGDWVVRAEDGIVSILPDAVFKQQYEAA